MKTQQIYPIRPGRPWTRRRLLARAAMAGAGLAVSGPLPANALEPPPPRPLQTGDSGRTMAGAGSLRAHAEARGLLMGCAVNTGLLAREPAYGRVLAEQFNLVVGENCMKWGALRPTATTYDFREADALVAFATDHGMKVRGHNLCWHESLPPWFAATVTRENARQILTDHIHTVAGRYRGRIESWDVLNEAIWPKDGRPDGMRQSAWYDLLGPEYVEIAFRAAHQADPDAVLTYNDYGIEYDTAEELAKRASVLALVQRLQRAGVPIGGIGIQSHLRTGDIGALGPGIHDFVRKVGKLGLRVYLSEMDVNDDGLADDQGISQQDGDVAFVYRHYLEAVLQEPSVKALLTWGLADSQSWLAGDKWRPKHPDRAQRPLLFSVSDGAYAAKPAWYAVRNAIDAVKRR